MADEYDAAWDDLRRIRRRYARPIGFLMALAIAVVALNLAVGIPNWLGVIIFPAAAAAFLMIAVAQYQLLFFRCPRCKRRFIGWYGPRHRWGDACANCGLHEYESNQWQRIDLRGR
jgi:hypothetical protein